MPRKSQKTKEPTPDEKKLAEFGDIMHDIAIFDRTQYDSIFRSVEFRQGETPSAYVERMQIFAGPPLMKMAIANVKKNPNLSAKIFMFYWKPVMDKQAIDLNVRQQSPVDVMSDAEVVKGLVRELVKNPESRRILEDELGKANYQLGRPELPETIDTKGENNGISEIK